MASQTRAYRLRLHAAGTATPIDGTVDFTLVLDGGQEPYVPGPEADVTRGKTESRPWQVAVRDTNGALTGNLGTSGRPDVLMRLVELQVNEDSGGYTTMAVGRLIGLTETDGPDSFIARVADERVIERRTEIFDAEFRNNVFGRYSTTRLFPRGRLIDWRGNPANGALRATAHGIVGNLVRLTISGQSISQVALDFLREDLVDFAVVGRTDGSGNFEHTRLNLDGTDFEVVQLARSLTAADPLGVEEDRATDVWIYMATPPAAGTTYANAYLHAPTADPHEDVPYHFAGHPFQIVSDIYDEVGIRYDSAAMAAIAADDRYGTVAFRITELANLAEWLETYIYQPTMVVPLINASGEVTPKSVLVPRMAGATYDALPTLTAADLSSFPTWEHDEGSAVTVVRAKLTSYLNATAGGLIITDPLGLFANVPPREVKLDGLAAVEGERRVRHDTIARMGEKILVVDLSGWITGTEQQAQAQVNQFVIFPDASNAEGVHDAYAKETFNRFGDGPIIGRFEGMESAVDVDAGAFFKIQLDSFPNPEVAGRGGTRVAQAIRQGRGAVGFDFEYLDAGQAAQPLATPTITIAQNVANPKHAVDVTIASTPAGAGVTLLFGEGAAPTVWNRTESKNRATGLNLADGTYTFKGFPSGTTIGVQGYATLANRIPSEMSAVDSVATTALTAPSAVAATATDRSITATWTNGETQYSTMPTLDGVDSLDTPLGAGSTVFTWDGLDASTLYTVGVRHVDPYGGESALATDTATTSTAGTLPTVPGAALIQYRAASTDPVPPPDFFGPRHGFEVLWVPHETAESVWESSTVSNFATVETSFRFGPETSRAFLQFGGIDNAVRYLRVRYEQAGYAAGANKTPSPTSAYLTSLHRMVPDRFLDLTLAQPTITRFVAEQGADALHQDLSFRVEDANNLGGTLSVWTSANVTTGPDPSGAEDASIAVASTPFDATAATAFTTGDADALNEVLVSPRGGKTVYVEFENANGVSSGVLPFQVQGINRGLDDATGLIDPDVELKGGGGIFYKQLPADPNDADSVPASLTKQFVAPSYVDASLRVDTVRRSAADEPVDNLFKKSSDTADVVVPSATRDFVAPAYVDTSKRVTTVRRSVTDEPSENLFKRSSDGYGDINSAGAIGSGTGSVIDVDGSSAAASSGYGEMDLSSGQVNGWLYSPLLRVASKGIAGDGIRIGKDSLAATATSGFPAMTAITGAPTGAPSQAVGGGKEFAFETSTGRNVLWIYGTDSAGSAEWAGIPLSYAVLADDLALQGDYLAIKDSIIAPTTVTGFALIYVDTADGDLKVKFADGTVKTIVVDT